MLTLKTHSPLFELLKDGDIGTIIKVLGLRLETDCDTAKTTLDPPDLRQETTRTLREIKASFVDTMESAYAHLYAARMKA